MVKANWPGNPYAGMGVQNLIKQMQKECQHDAKDTYNKMWFSFIFRVFQCFRIKKHYF